MHSSIMRTARLLTVCLLGWGAGGGLPSEGGLPAQVWQQRKQQSNKLHNSEVVHTLVKKTADFCQAGIKNDLVDPSTQQT